MSYFRFMSNQIRLRQLAALLLLLPILMACQAADLRNTDPYAAPVISDPNEERHRLIFQRQLSFSQDKGLAFSKSYLAHTPSFFSERLNDFSTNLQEPRNFVASLLQLKGEKAIRSLMRFTINTIFGLFGTIDIFKAGGVEDADEDFGQVFAKWGFQQGDFIVLPTGQFSTSRDFLGSIFDLTLDPGLLLSATVSPVWLALGARVPFTFMDNYARNAPLINSLGQSSIDPYLTFRNSYLSARRQQILETSLFDLYNE